MRDFRSTIVEVPGRGLVYKTRTLRAVEYAEIGEVLERLIGGVVDGFPEIIDFRLTQLAGERRLHLLVEHVDGISLAHRHNAAWDNEPSFTDWVRRRPIASRMGLVRQAERTIEHLHELGLHFPDFKTEQLMIRDGDRLCVVDIDGVVLRGGFVARMGLWHSPALPREPRSDDAADQRRMARVRHELIHGTHAEG
nr:hypothetical protein GCM10020092_022350 [Actinoplanes digitatis]